MASMSRGTPGKVGKAYKVVKPKSSRKHGTVSTKNHRFRSFNERIANLKIDPIRRKRHIDSLETRSDETHTHFGQALAEWQDTNLSRTFTAFAKEAAPLCDSLPVVLHNENKIMDLLILYLEKADALAMEPILNLLSHFARDLDTRFEVHFQRAVGTITAVAAQHSDLAVVESSFTSLAWLFKYLARLLIPDLRPLYDLLAPYLGKKSHRAFVVRFSAEAFSFLVRKAAVTYMKDSEPLDTVMEHVLDDCAASMSDAAIADLHCQGIMTMLVEAMKGVQNGLNTSAIPVLESLLKVSGNLIEKSGAQYSRLVCGILTSLVHHCTVDSFKPIQDVITAYAMESSSLPNQGRIALKCDVLFTVISTRKGTRISDWKTVMQAVRNAFDTCELLDNIQDSTVSSMLGLLAGSMQMATIGAALANIQIFERLRNNQWALYFLKFCDLFARLGPDRFKEILLPEFRRYMIEDVSEGCNALFALIPRIAHCCPGLKLRFHPAFLVAILDSLEAFRAAGLPNTDRLATLNNKLAATPFLELSDKQSKDLRISLLRLVQATLQSENGTEAVSQAFVLGTCFRFLLEVSEDMSDLANLWPQLCAVSPHMIGLTQFWSNLLRYIKSIEPARLEGPPAEVLPEALVTCLHMPSHTTRQDALAILQDLYRIDGNDPPNALATAITIESTPISLDSSRSISMHIRRLGQEYNAQGHDEMISKAAPSYCFGLLHLNLAQAWDDAMNSLKLMSESKGGEEMIMSLLQSWLDGQPDNDDNLLQPVFLDINSDGFKVLSDFECPNLAKLSAICQQVFDDSASGISTLAAQCEAAHKNISPFTASSRSQALKVLNKIPGLAEKRSRMLVPILLRWAGHSNAEVDESAGVRWERKDQKAMLSVFAQFNNPKVLYKSTEVYDALLCLCANGDVEIQRSALKAILAWKDPVLKSYDERLNNLLDEARFREEISVFLRDRSDDDDEEGILPEDHAHLMPVLLRLIYGRAVAGGKEGQASRRKAIFVALSRFGEETLKQFLRIALPGSNQKENNAVFTKHCLETTASLRQQLGMLNMVNDMLQILGVELEPFVGLLMGDMLPSTIIASRKLETLEENADGSLLRDVRQTGMQCLVQIFTHMSDFDPEPYGEVIIQELIKPRLKAFASENAQSISALTRLFSAWSTRSTTALLFVNDGVELLDCVAGLLEGQHTKPEVQIFVLQDILDNLMDEGIDEFVLKPHITHFVKAIGLVIKRQPSKDVLDVCVKSFSRIANRISSGHEAADVARICNDLLLKPGKSVPMSIKTGLLRTLLPLIDRFHVEAKSDLYRVLCALFSRVHGAESRQLLSQVLTSLVKDEPELLEAAGVCEGLNAIGKRLDEPDHERRERAFAWIYSHCKTTTLEQWSPLVHNCLFYIRDSEDRVNRSSASHALRLFVDATAASVDQSPWLALLDDDIVSGIEYGVKDSSELVRAEYIAVLGHIVKSIPTWVRINDMEELAVNGDDEASFFSNILHIQQHRRLRALRRLSDEASKLGSLNASRLLVPLLEHFVFDPVEGDSGRTLADQTVQTIGILSTALNRQNFRAYLQRYTSYLKSKPDMEKTVLRLLGAMVDSIGPADQRLTPAIINAQLPPLLEYLHLKDESTVDRRMPVAVTIVKLMRALPEADFASRLPAVLTDVSHVLRSRSQEARDQTRKALTSISKLIGPLYFRFILKELRSALRRGYQLHVLSYTVHALLVDADYEGGDLDECLPELMLVIMDDIFGVTGQEKDAEEYKSGMKEVKSSKSFDTLELLARITPVQRLGELVRPIRAMLSEKLDVKMVKKLDELLTRLRKGLDLNPAAESRDMLSFCWEMVNHVHAERPAAGMASTSDTRDKERRKRYLVQPEAPKSLHSKGSTASYSFKLVSFALNLLRKVVRRHEDLLTPQNMAGFLPITGDAFLQPQEEVKLSALRLLSTIMKLPMSQLEEDIPVYIKEAVALVKAAPNMSTDGVKAALEMVTSVLRDKRSVQVKEKDMATLLKCIKSDLDEPDRQGVIFKFLRAVLGRKIVITEVYEVMDEVGKAMVTNPDTSVRESARSAYFQFVMEYPQGKDRWQKQTTFLVGNLQYEHASGRKSVMEFLHQMLGKVSDDIMAETSPRIFVSLLLVLVSDSDTHCRAMARLLVGKLFDRAGDAQMKHFLSMMSAWLRKEKKSSVKTGALQCWTILIGTRDVSQEQLEGVRDKLEEVLEEDDEPESNSAPQLILSALETFSALIQMAPAVGFGVAAGDLWQTLQKLPTSDDAEIQESVATLLGSCFEDFAKASSTVPDGLAGLPLRGTGGLELGSDDMRRLCTGNLESLQLVGLNTSEHLKRQISSNLRFLGRCFDANGIPWDDQETDPSSASDDDEENGNDEDHDDSESPGKDRSALAYLLRRLCRIIATDSYSVIARTTSLQCMMSLIRQLTDPQAHIHTLLRPLYTLTDPSVPKPPGELHQALQDQAHEALEVMQKRVGSETYVAALAETRKAAQRARDERRRKRKMGAVAQPEKWERAKRRKHELKKEKIKARGAESRGRRRGW